MHSVKEIAQQARSAGKTLATLESQKKNAILQLFADKIDGSVAELMNVNSRDVADAISAALNSALIDRLRLTDAKIRQMADAVRQVSSLPEPVGHVLRHTLLDDGLVLRQIAVPYGTVAAIVESRPDAVVQLMSLMVKSSNALIVKAGQEATHTVKLIQRFMHESLLRHGVPYSSVTVVHGREAVAELLKLDGLIDLVIPRGSKELVQYVQRNTRIPVLGHADGICHVYVDTDADLQMATRIIIDAKTQAPSACNAVETVLVHRNALEWIPVLVMALKQCGVRVNGCAQTVAIAGVDRVTPITEDSDWAVEYGELAVAIKVVSDLEAAMAHIRTFGSRHTDAIITANAAIAERFLHEVDSANVVHNASTRFSDGYRYGLGAEVGISTGKLPPRGPVGLDGLVTYKWVLCGNGHVSAQYQGVDAKLFKHVPLPLSSPA